MQNVILSLLVNGLMAGLLLATMIYCWRLNTRIKVLQDSKSELARIVQEFDESTQRATQSIADIHAATTRLSENIQHKIDKANYLASDLEYMIEKGNRMTGKTEAPASRPAPAAQPFATAPASRPAAKSTAFMLPDDPAEASAAASPRPTRVRSRAEQEIMSALSAKNTSRE